MDTLAPITELEYLEAETVYLIRHLKAGDRASAAVSAATIRQTLWQMGLADVPARIATKNGQYYRWPFLDE